MNELRQEKIYHEIVRLRVLSGLLEIVYSLIDGEITSKEIEVEILEVIRNTGLTDEANIYEKEKAEN